MQILRVCLNYSMRREIVKLLSGAVSSAGVLLSNGQASHHIAQSFWPIWRHLPLEGQM
jgi:hypothetical protein